MDREVVEVGGWVWSKDGELRRVLEIDKAGYSTLADEDDEIVSRHEPVKKLVRNFQSEVAGLKVEEKEIKDRSTR